MNAQAGDIDRGFLRQQEHLAPLPIPTGQPPQDLMNIIWRKNPVYLDIGSFAMGGYDPTLGNSFIYCDFCLGRCKLFWRSRCNLGLSGYCPIGGGGDHGAALVLFYKAMA